MLTGLPALTQFRERPHVDATLAAFRAIGDRPADARALRELGRLLRDQRDLADAGVALNASQAIFEALGDALWTARILVSKATWTTGAAPIPRP
jgi:hypothetical protein